MTKPYIKTILQDIERADYQSLDIPALAKSSFVSPMQLYRDFYSATGYSLHEYLRRRRLSKALALIKASGSNLAGLAYDCGYSSQQALCRDIKDILGITATQYRDSPDYYVFPQFCHDAPCHVAVQKTSIPETQCLLYFASQLTGLENAALARFFHQNPEFRGRLFGRDRAQRRRQFCYALYAETVPGCNINPDGFEDGGRFPAYSAFCAQTTVPNEDPDISAAWDYLYAGWLTASMFEYAGENRGGHEAEYFEEYLYKSSVPYRLKLYLPIVKRSDIAKITLETPPPMTFLVAAQKGMGAEMRASRVILDYLSKRYPYVVRSARHFFVQHQNDICTCGVRVPRDIQAHAPAAVRRTGSQPCATLYSRTIGDYHRYRQLLLSWLYENRIAPSGDVYVVYDTTDGFANPKMRLSCPISRQTC